MKGFWQDFIHSAIRDFNNDLRTDSCTDSANDLSTDPPNEPPANLAQDFPYYVTYDPEWLSPCLHIIEGRQYEQGDCVKWSPVEREGISLSNLEDALSITIPDDIHQFYCSVFADYLDVVFQDMHLTLIQVWNQEDFEHLQQNLIGHVLMKKRLEQPVTLFIGLTRDDEVILSVDPATGAVGLEVVGQPQHRVLANSLSAFCQELSLAR